MKILALEFSSSQRSVAVVQGAPDTPASSASEVIQTGSREGPGLGLIEDALRLAGVEREQIECLAIGLGPGSYVGIRSAVSLAQGWQLARPAGGLKLLGISSAECLAAQAQAEGLTGPVHVVIDAQRNEFYLATYELSLGVRRETASLRLASFAEVEALDRAGAVLVGPEVLRWFQRGRQVFPRAAVLGQLAAQRTDFCPGDKLEPIYLRETRFVKAPPLRPRVA
jgi:tRNA threonylcarbamoyl adenosine modification protein YeaZ